MEGDGGVSNRRMRELQDRYPDCVVERTKKNGHIRITLPNGRKVFTSYSPRDHRTDKNLHSDMKKSGYGE